MMPTVFGRSNDQKPWTNPFPEANGFLWAFRGGDMVSPSGWQLRPDATAGAEPNFFNAIPRHVRRLYFGLPVLPFFSFRWGRFGGYIGWKCYGLDSPVYRDWPGVNPAEVQDGALALTGFTARLTFNLRSQ